MNSPIIRNSKFIKNPLSLSKLKAWILDDFLPLLIIITWILLICAPVHQPIIIIYTCLKWKGFIIFWLGYFLWTQYDLKTLETGGRKISSVKCLSIFNSIRRYFPLRLIKVANLPSDKNYILACFPHAVLPIGCFANLCTNTNSVAELFPDIDIRTVTLSSMFHFPLTRELLMAFGLCTANKKNILHLLNSSPSKAVMVFPGGIKEYRLSHPGKVYTIVKNRKGFIRVALESGSSLVPVFSFGEQNTFDTQEFKSPILIGLNKLFYKCTRGTIILVMGRGFFRHNYGILPHRRPITTVVGKPIDVPKVENPPAELVDEYHERFFNALIDLFKEYKYKYDEAGDEAQLVMV